MYADPVLDQLVHWANQQQLIRAVILTSSRAIPDAAVDLFSDYDVILVMRSIQSFYVDRSWLNVFGPVLAVYRDPLIDDHGQKRSAYVVQYETGLKIDFNLWPVELLQQVTASERLPPEFDAGYKILVDKDHLTTALTAPTYAAYIPTPPSETHYLELIEGFFLDTTYVAKFLWRDDLMAAKHILDHSLKQEHLRPMLEWHAEIDHHWKLKPGPYGRRLKQHVRPDLWAELEATYCALGIEENWQALFRTIALMRRIATEVGQHLGYTYPQELDQRAMDYLSRVRHLDRSSLDRSVGLG
ncbi:MAG TPA: aminoglycoside 6-adenylyltransferase [Pyrinomonadaceae bacterium]|nr:aminoglycoside 6-adenylyltransferase [Pyrinomonadaceae bacterium]